MLEIRPTCENCDKPLPNESHDAMICSFECTFCRDCVTNVLLNVCPNCGGGFVNRPIRPKKGLANYPASEKRKHKPVDMETYLPLQNKMKGIWPEER